MHILLIHQAFVGPGEAGGTRHYEFARLCIDHGHRFTVVASPISYLSGKRMQLEDQGADLGGVHVLRAYAPDTLHRSFLWRIFAFIGFMVSSVIVALRAGPVDLVMGTTPPIFQALSAWIVAALRRRPFLLEVRDLWPAFAIDMGVLHNPVLIGLARWLEAFLYGRASHIVVNSPAYRDYLLARSIPAGRITLIPNGVDPAMFSPEDEGSSVRQTLGLEGQFVVTYAGALGEANDIPTLVQAAERVQTLPELHVLLVGDGKERARLEAMVKDRQITNVTFTGAVPKERMAGILAASDVCVAILKNIPMFRTTYPNKVFDYMAAGRPTLLAIDGVIREVIELSRGGLFVPPGDVETLAEAMRYFYHHRPEGRSMGLSARAYVCDQFDRRRQVETFLDLTQRLAKGSSTASS